jgi:hypothetical protein
MKYFRVVTLVVGFFAVQLSLVGGSLACPVASYGSSIARQADHAPTMTGMRMSGEPASSQQRMMAHGDSPTEHPCDQTGLPQSCQALASCAAPFAAAAADRHASVSLPSSGAPVLSVLAPQSPTLLPELPPPRA